MFIVFYVVVGDEERIIVLNYGDSFICYFELVVV